MGACTMQVRAWRFPDAPVENGGMGQGSKKRAGTTGIRIGIGSVGIGSALLTALTAAATSTVGFEVQPSGNFGEIS